MNQVPAQQISDQNTVDANFSDGNTV